MGNLQYCKTGSIKLSEHIFISSMILSFVWLIFKYVLHFDIKSNYNNTIVILILLGWLYIFICYNFVYFEATLS